MFYAYSVKCESDQKHSIDAPIILRDICDLGILAPDHFAARGDQAQLADIHLNYGSLRDDPQRGVRLAVGVLPAVMTTAG